MLRVSRGLSWVQSGDRVCGSDSPVREELSTCTNKRLSFRPFTHFLFYPSKLVKLGANCYMDTHLSMWYNNMQEHKIYRVCLCTLQPWEDIILRSAGILSPPFTSTRSPATTSSALICIFSPSRITKACCV